MVGKKKESITYIYNNIGESMQISNNILEIIIAKLEDKYPNVLPTTITSDIQLAKLQGNQEVITYLKGYIDINKRKKR